MKKQILFMAFVTLALIFAGTSTAWGQVLSPRTAPAVITPLTCATAANFLHPIAGVAYTYQMDGTTGPEDVIGWTWFATKNPAFITPGASAAVAPALSSDSLKANTVGQLLEAGGNYGVIGSATNSVSITWSPEILSNTLYQGDASTTVFPSPTFVVGYGKGQNCADNIQVFEINPIQNFTLDIANIDAAGVTLAWDAPTTQCVDVVQSATYNNTSNAIDMNYGKDTLYFEVVAANFVTSWSPTFTKISGLNGVQTADLGMATSLVDARAGNFIANGTTTWTAASTNWATGVTLTAAPADVANGVSVFVRVIISNLTYESLAANAFVLAADAIDAATPAKWDMEEADCTALVNTADQVDQATHTVNPRPTIIGSNVPDTNALAPNDIIIKTP
jgi:hypothetical protein